MAKKTSPKYLDFDHLRTRGGKVVPWAGPESMAEELFLASPEELADAVRRFQDSMEHPQAEPGLTAVGFILRSLEKEAAKILDRAHGDSVQVESAEDVLTRSLEVRDAINSGMAEDAALRMMFLTASAIRMKSHDHTMSGRYESAKQKKRGMERGDQRKAAADPWAENLRREAAAIRAKDPRCTERGIASRLHRHPSKPGGSLSESRIRKIIEPA